MNEYALSYMRQLEKRRWSASLETVEDQDNLDLTKRKRALHEQGAWGEKKRRRIREREVVCQAEDE